MNDDFQQQAGAPNKLKEMPPLTSDQMEYAHELLDELHPLEKTPVRAAFQWLGVVTCYKQTSVEDTSVADNEAQLLDKKKVISINGKEVVKKAPKKKKNPLGDAVKEDPLAKLGFGIVAYIDMLWTLIWTFLLYSIFLLPTMMYFGQGGAYDNVPAGLKSDYLDTYLGNMGYSSVQCVQIPADLGSMSVGCPYGTIGEFLSFGVNSSLKDKTVCSATEDNARCTPDNPVLIDQKTASIGQKSAILSWKASGLYNTAKTGCLVGDSSVFVQFTCIQDEQTLAEQYDQIALAVATGCLIVLLFCVSIRKMYQGGKLQQLEWDVTTVTAGDYSVTFEINERNYRQWVSLDFNGVNGGNSRQEAPAFALKKHMSKVVEDQLTEWVNSDAATQARSEIYGDSGKVYGGTKVADIVFSFNNADLIKALQVRGGHIASQDFDAMRAQELVINDLFKDFDKLTIPTDAFITFESDDSAEFAKEISECKPKTQYEMLGQPFEFTTCSEPTDIIWENRHFTARDYLFRQLAAGGIVSFLLLGSVILIYWISAVSAKTAATFPAVNCPGIETVYGAQLQSSAIKDYNFITDQSNVDAISDGTLQCWCTSDTQKASDTATVDANGDNICEYFQAEVDQAFYLTSILSYILIAINYILRTVCIACVDWIGYDTETERLSKTSTVTFLVQFFNSAFLLLMVNADMSEQPFDFFLTTGSLPDFNTQWFRTVGDIIVAAMVFNVYYPILEVLGYWALRGLTRCMDRGCKWSSTTTKSTSIQGYINTYQGPQYFMHYKYSSVLTIVYMTFMFGFGMPVLFPIAMASFLVLYGLEKGMLFYGYVMPPMYDERLSNDVLSKLQFAPFLYVCFGYWMVSNQQLLSNDHLTAVTLSTDTYITNHGFGSLFTSTGWEGIKWPLFVLFFILNLVWYAGEPCVNLLTRCFPNLAIGDVEIDEDIDNYWAALDEEDRKWSLKEEENARTALKTKILTDSQYEALKSSEMTKRKTLQGVHSYDILANPLYLDDFQYVTAAEDDRDEMIIDDDDDEGNDAMQSDLVRICLNLAYMREEDARDFKFNKSGMKSALGAIKNNIQ